MSSTNAGSTPDLLCTALSIPYNKESAEVSLKAPFLARVIALRTASVTTTSSGFLTSKDSTAARALLPAEDESLRLRALGTIVAALSMLRYRPRSRAGRAICTCAHDESGVGIILPKRHLNLEISHLCPHLGLPMLCILCRRACKDEPPMLSSS